MAYNPLEIRDSGSEQQALRPAGINSASLAAFSGNSMLGLDQAPSPAALSSLPGLDLFDSQLVGTANNTGAFPNGSLSNFMPSEGSTFSASQLGNDLQSLTNMFSPPEQLQAGGAELNSLLSTGTAQLDNFLNAGTSNLGALLNTSSSDVGNLLNAGPSDLSGVLNNGTDMLTGLLTNDTPQFTGAISGTMPELPNPPSPTQLTGLLQVGLTDPIEGIQDTLKSIF